MASGGEGFGTERARLAGDGLGTERARLAQGGFWGQIYKRNPFKQSLRKSPNFAQKVKGGSSLQILLNEISEYPKIWSKICGEGQFYKRNPSKRIF